MEKLVINKTFKPTSISTVVAIFFSTLILIACESHEQRPDEGFDLVKKEKARKEDSSIAYQKVVKEPNETSLTKKTNESSNHVAAESADEWTNFKAEMTKKILINEKKIKEIKKSKDSDNKLFKKVTSLERDNYDLRMQMVAYEEETKKRLLNFKNMINKEFDDVSAELSDIVKSEKK